jgi:hypothetical protein
VAFHRRVAGPRPRPSCDDIGAEQFHRFFDNKVAGVRSATAGASPPSFKSTSSVASFLQFQPVSIDEVAAAVRGLPDKGCSLDLLPTRLFKAAIDLIAPFLTELFNHSLSTGRVPEVFKAAYITPLLKKTDMDPADPRSFRPISNLSVLSTLLERLVARSYWPISTYRACSHGFSSHTGPITQRRRPC